MLTMPPLCIQEFFLYVKSVLRSVPSGVEYFQKWGDRELALNQALSKARADVHAALCGESERPNPGGWAEIRASRVVQAA